MESVGFRQEYWVRVRLRDKSPLEHGADTWSVSFAALSSGPRKHLAHNKHSINSS